MTTKIPNTRDIDQKGMVSIVVTLVFIMVISLTVLGFTQVTQRNSRQALDRQLSSQAYYAAETAINDVMNRIANLVESGEEEVTPQTECEGPYTRNNGNVETVTDATVKYSCLIVDPSPPRLEYNNIGGESVIIPLQADVQLPTQHLEWKRAPVTDIPASVTAAGCQGLSTHTAPTRWRQTCPFGILRLDIVPVITNPADPMNTIKNPEAAARATMTTFIYPRSGGAVPTIAYDRTVPNAYGTGAQQGLIASASCDHDTCRADLSGLTFSSAYMRASMIYVDSPTFAVSMGGELYKYSQVVIDVTGRAEDVVRRVKVRVSFNGGSSRSDSHAMSDYSLLTTDSICKRFNTAPNYAAPDSVYTCN